MSSLMFVSSMALDIICFIEKISLGEHNFVQWMSNDQISEIEKINAQLPSGFDDD